MEMDNFPIKGFCSLADNTYLSVITGNSLSLDLDEKVTEDNVIVRIKGDMGKLTAGKKQLKVKASVKNADSWQIRYRIEDGYKWKTKKVSGSKSTVTIKGLKTGTKYEVKARSCKVKNGRNYYSRWSETKVSGKIK